MFLTDGTRGKKFVCWTTYFHSIRPCAAFVKNLYMHFKSMPSNSHEQEFSIHPLKYLHHQLLLIEFLLWPMLLEFMQSFPAAFCNTIGLREACTVTLKTSLSSTSSWQVRVLPYKDTSHQVGSGWKSFCEENMIKEGDLCTFNVIEMMLWHVIIDRC